MRSGQTKGSATSERRVHSDKGRQARTESFGTSVTLQYLRREGQAKASGTGSTLTLVIYT